MPSAAPHPCTYPGCRELVRHGNSRCEKHRDLEKKQAEAARPNARERGYDYRWEKARKAFLAAHPLCERCKANGVYRQANVVDHVVPHKGDRALFWDWSNWMALCKPCHDSKTAREDGAWGRKVGEGKPIGCDGYGMPTDPRHPWAR